MYNYKKYLLILIFFSLYCPPTEEDKNLEWKVKHDEKEEALSTLIAKITVMEKKLLKSDEENQSIRTKCTNLEAEAIKARSNGSKFNKGTVIALNLSLLAVCGLILYGSYRFMSRNKEEKDAEKAYQEALAADPSLSYTYGQIQDLNLHRAEVEIGLVKKPETPYVPKSISEEEAYQRTRAIGLEKARQMEVEVKEEIARRKAKREKDEREYFEKYEKLAAEKQAKLKADKGKQKNEGLFGSEAKKETPTSSEAQKTKTKTKTTTSKETTEEETEEAKKKKALSKANG